MVRQFELGGVYKFEVGIKDEEIGASFLIKVVGLDRTRSMLPWAILQYHILGKSTVSARTAEIEAPPLSDYDIGTFFGRSSDTRVRRHT